MTLSSALHSISDNSLTEAKDSCQTVDILFIGLDDREIDAFLSLIRTGGLSPRGRRIESRESLLQALRTRAWDLLLCRSNSASELNTYRISNLLQHLDKDIPLIKLSPEVSPEAQLKAFRDGAQALLPLQPGELLVHVVVQQLNALITRRRLRQSEALLDISERHHHERVLSSRTAIGYIRDGQICFANQQLIELLGYTHEQQILGLELSQLLLPEQRTEVPRQLQTLLDQHQPIDTTMDLSVVRADNSAFPAHVQFQTCRYDSHTCLSIGITPEQPQYRRSKEDDALTGLKNAIYLVQRLDEAAQRALNGGNDTQLIYIRLDQYDAILAQQGQEAIDGLVTRIAEELSKYIQEPHLLCRFEEDSFAILFHHPSSEETLTLTRKLARQISTLQYQAGENAVSSTASIGLVSINDTAPPASEILHRARRAADSLPNGNGSALYHSPPPLHSQANDDAVRRILKAITECRLKLLYQPIVPLDEHDQTHYYEVLIRLLDDNDAPLPPNTFMTAVEQSDVMIKMDRWILERSMQELHEAGQGQNSLLFINIAGRTLRSRSLLNWFAVQMRELDIAPAQIVFQISETDAAAEQEAALTFTKAVQTLGCGLCLKHFGSSPSSQRVVETLQPRFLKLDGAYVQDLASGELRVDELKDRLQPALDSGKTLIAPLVENNRVISKLFHCGVQLIQGYYLQSPQDKMEYDYFEE